jgi:peptidoglycan hydrolase FlgJ
LIDFNIQHAGQAAIEAGPTPRTPQHGSVSFREAAREFEGYFASYLLKVMRETVPKGLFENKAGQMFYSFYDQEIGRLSAQAGGLGLAKGLEQLMGAEYMAQVTEIPLKSGQPSTDNTPDILQAAPPFPPRVVEE